MKPQMNIVEADQTKKPGDVGASIPAELNPRSHSTTKEEIVSMLEALLRHCNEDVETLIPLYDHRQEMEAIEVKFFGGGSRIAFVAADSHLAICRDVLNQAFR